MRSKHRSHAVRRTSDAEITRPLNELPLEPPALPAWHVHLELQPDELITLHRLGLTGGALAWREGMPEWQPLRDSDSALPDADATKINVDVEESLPQPIPLTRRSARSGSGSLPSFERPRSLFSSGRHSSPPIASAVAMPHLLERPRPELLLPPPPPIETRSGPPEHSPTRSLALVRPLHAERSPVSVTRERQPPSIPPLALDARPRPAQRGVGSRALWLGAAALVALSASNGALVSALIWSLRHDLGRATAAAAPSSRPVAAVTAGKSSSNAAGASQANNSRVGPVSIDQLPLAASGPTAGERSASSAPRAANSRKGSARVAPADAAPNRRAEPANATTPTTPGPIDRRALVQAVGRAAGAAASCADGPEKGRVALTFSPSGSVQAANLEQSFGDPGINSCVLRAMGRARVRAFVGEPVTVHKTLAW